jgi:hypothetical protein
MSDPLSRPRTEKELKTTDEVNIQNVNSKTKINSLETNQKKEIYNVHNNTK